MELDEIATQKYKNYRNSLTGSYVEPSQPDYFLNSHVLKPRKLKTKREPFMSTTGWVVYSTILATTFLGFYSQSQSQKTQAVFEETYIPHEQIIVQPELAQIDEKVLVPNE